ncbi:uncharacterized protein V2V93DRAFT_366261 [Kockiozyma suomiensis]|uniref:uncharacterized protein n=1 Tax=Kockiozyma suomiensis TaxID=1337062 RepID=UPI0033435F95
MLRRTFLRPVVSGNLSFLSPSTSTTTNNAVVFLRSDSALALSALQYRGFHASHSRFAGDDGNQNRKSPYQVFVETFREEWGKSKELQENIKALQDETGRMSESEAYRKAKDAYEKAKSGTSKTAETFKAAGKVVGSAASTAWESPIVKGTRDAVNATAEELDKATAPIRDTKVYKEVKNVIDDGTSRRYGGFEARDERRRRREEKLAQKMKEKFASGEILRSNKPTEENLEAGANVIIHPTAKAEEEKVKSSFRQSVDSLKEKIDESENPVVSTFRGIASRIGGFFAETEYAQVTRMFKEMDPTFTMEGFLQEVREFILPEVIDAYVRADDEALKHWLSEAPYNIWHASAKQFKEAGLYSASRVLDIRNVDIASAKILPPSDIPVVVISARAQEIHIYKNLKTNEIAAGTVDHIQQSTYAMVLTRIPEEMDDPETNGWRILELVRGQTRDWT